MARRLVCDGRWSAQTIDQRRDGRLVDVEWHLADFTKLHRRHEPKHGQIARRDDDVDGFHEQLACLAQPLVHGSVERLDVARCTWFGKTEPAAEDDEFRDAMRLLGDAQHAGRHA